MARVTESGDAATAVAELLEAWAYHHRVHNLRGDLPQAQWVALRFLATCNATAATVMSFAKLHGITGGTASRTIGHLERRRLVARQANSTDRRSYLLRVTDKGRQMLAKEPLNIIKAAIQGMGVSDLRIMGDGLNAALRALPSERGRRSS